MLLHKFSKQGEGASAATPAPLVAPPSPTVPKIAAPAGL
jgi:hypothetical protein